MSRFPAMGVKALLAKYPQADQVVQLRLATRDGTVVCLEGILPAALGSAIFHAFFGPKQGASSTEEANVTRAVCGDCEQPVANYGPDWRHRCSGPTSATKVNDG